MKRTNWTCGVLLAALAILSGCGKSNKPPPPPVAFGAHIDMAKLQDTLATNTNAEVQSGLAKIAAGLRYGYDYLPVLAELDKLSQNPSLTEPQKKVVNDTIEQVKQVAAEKQPK